ncbi:MAG TPA: hypothetical protein VHM19_16310 [Polyangiales bacterium]|nr:hypothetical protein [Polyangiales bacterium]
MKSILNLALCSLWLVAVGCAPKMIPNTRVPDTGDNREVLDFVEKYRKAVEQRDIGTLLQMTSQDYFDDMGTPAGEDDVDYEALQAGLQRLRQEVLGARYQISYRAVTFTDTHKVLVDLLYTGWFKVSTPDGAQWRRRLEPHRIVLAREDHGYKIVSGM